MSEGDVVRLAESAMGCRFELVLAGGPESFLRAAGEEAIEAIEEAHALLTRFEPGSVVSRLNASVEQRVDGELFGLFETCERLREESGGVFDIARGGEIVLDRARRSVRVVCGDVDMGAIGKGYAVDLAVRVLEEAGVSAAFVHGGTSTCRAFGEAPEGGWVVEVGASTGRDPIRVDVGGRALAVSGDEVQGAHIVDPRSGERVNGGAFGACVGASATLCDVWSTVLAVTGGRPGGMPGEYESVVVDRDGWRVEPSGRRVLEERLGCRRSTVVRS